MLKKILIGIAGLLALSIIAMVVLVMRFDPNSYKDTLTALVKEKKTAHLENRRLDFANVLAQAGRGVGQDVLVGTQ